MAREQRVDMTARWRRALRLVWLIALCASVLSPLSAWAFPPPIPQPKADPADPPAEVGPRPNPTPPTPDLTPPTILSTPEVPYPAGAHGEAVVVLMLKVGRDGKVEEARAIDGEQPFADAAVAAAENWIFEPARRQGQAVTARIRFEVRFHAELPKPGAHGPIDSVSPNREPSSAPKAAAPPPSPTEIVIVGERSPPGVSTMTRAEVRQLPGAFGDPFRAIEALPGVTPIISGIPFFYLRGAPPGNIGYYLDGVRVPYLYHVGLGPSVIHPAMVEKVDLHAGGYPAQFGRFVGGIVAAETTAPRTSLHGEANARLFDAGAMAETGFANGRGTALLGARYSFTATLLSLLAPEAHFEYRDFEARVSYDLTPKDRVTVFTFGAFDLIGENRNNQLNVLFGSEFYRMDTRYDRKISPDTTLRAGITLGYDRTKIPGEPRAAKNQQILSRVELTHAASAHMFLRGGADTAFEAYRVDAQPYADPDAPETQAFNGLFPPRNDITMGVWADVVFKYPGVTVTPGLRADFFRSGSTNAMSVDPRVASRIELTSHLRALHTFGLVHQVPSFIIPVPGLAIGNLQGGLQSSLQSSAGVEFDLPGATTATVSLFDNVFLNMSDTLGLGQNTGDDDEAGGLASKRSLGSAVGAEVYIRRRLTRHLGGFLSYTLSRSMRSVGREHFPSAFDRTHVGNVALTYDLGRNWRAGTRFMLYTGIPSQTQRPQGDALPVPLRTTSPPRDPAFYRLDVRLEKRWVISPKVWMSFVAEIMNATLHKEVVFGTEIGPITIPSLGVEMGF